MKRELIVCMMLLAFIGVPATAAPKTSSNGTACETTGTARKDGKDDQGNKVNCLWDTCTFLECGTSGGQISNCVRKTEYSNPSDCHAAAKTLKGPKLRLQKAPTAKTLQ
jgi:hypothetical protein